MAMKLQIFKIREWKRRTQAGISFDSALKKMKTIIFKSF